MKHFKIKRGDIISLALFWKEGTKAYDLIGTWCYYNTPIIKKQVMNSELLRGLRDKN